MNLIKYNFKIIKFFIQIQHFKINRLYLMNKPHQMIYLKYFLQEVIKEMNLCLCLIMFILNKK